MRNCGLLICVLLGSFQDPSGPALIERLKNDSTRQAALTELIKRGNGDAGERRDPLLTVCPQEGGKPPIYVVLSRFLPERNGAGDPALFGPRGASLRMKERAIDAFSSEGKLITPFGGNNVITDGLLLDLNGDTLIERADHTSYGPDGVKTADVLEVKTVLETPRPLFAVVFNFHLSAWAREWGYDFTQPAKEGPWEIHLGPKKRSGDVERKVTYRWSKEKSTWVGPAGGKDDHFRVIDGKSIWGELKKLKTEGVSFPREPEERLGIPPDLDLEEDPKPAAGPDLPYKPGSLKALSPDALLQYMSDGAPQDGSRLTIPPGFWTAEPKAAALALVQANQSAKQVRLAVDDRDGVRAPAACIVTYTDQSSRCYFARDTHWTLRCDPQRSFLAGATQMEEGVALKGRLKNGKQYDLKYCELTYPEALQVTQALWWLSRVRSDQEEEDRSMMFSTADGKGDFHLRPAKGDPAASVVLDGTLWSGGPKRRWKGPFTKETCLNFSDAVLSHVLPARLGKRWPDSSHSFDMSIKERVPGQIRSSCTEILRRCAEEPESVSTAVAKVAIAAAGELAIVDALTTLTKLAGVTGLEEAVTVALQKLESGKDQKALERQAVAGAPDEAWALEQLRVRFPESHARILEQRLATAAGEEARNLFQQLEQNHPERALAFAAALSPDRRDIVAVDGFLLMHKSGKPIPEQQRRLQTIVQIALDRDAGWEVRRHAIDALTTAASTMEAIDDALLKLLDPALGDKNLNFTQSHAVQALVQRTGARHADPILAAFAGAGDSMGRQNMLPALARVGREPGQARDKVVTALRREFSETELMLNELSWCAWRGGLVELKAELERVATAGPDAAEGTQANSAGGGKKKVVSRCHGARRIAAVWNETDGPTKAKLLAAMAIGDLGAISDPKDLRIVEWDAQCVSTVSSLTAEGRRDVLAFVSAKRPQSRGAFAGSLMDRLESLLRKE